MTEKASSSISQTVQWLFNPSLRWLYHALFWMFIYSDELLSLLGITEIFDEWWFVPISLFVDMIVVYGVIYILLPLFLLRGRVTFFIFFSLFLMLLNTCVQLLLWNTPDTFTEEPLSYIGTLLITTFVNSGLIVGFAAGIKIFKNYILNEVRLKQLETDNLKTELVYLKNQINPHFLFNSLNNIYVLNRKDPAIASESILLLSDLLRYQLYDCNQERVSLSGEVEYLNNFLGLDRLRKDNTTMDFKVNGSTSGISIAPYVFLPFVENAIKHSSSANNEQGYLNILLEVKNGKDLLFVVENSKPEFPLITETGGIGLVNVKRRLELVYPEQHQLHIDNNDKYYKVSLNINLKNQS